ncbi:hypothetical protein EDB85DRAFT_1897548 [Lactarius pseudohatsudake]|nr:hypothetical protein EDB85DRAFT_1897548 [Lactarius pseudohatsudake]
MASLKGEPRKVVNLGTPGRVGNAAFADIQKPTRPTAMSGPEEAEGSVEVVEQVLEHSRAAPGLSDIQREGRSMETARRHAPVVLNTNTTTFPSRLRLAPVHLLHLRLSTHDSGRRASRRRLPSPRSSRLARDAWIFLGSLALKRHKGQAPTGTYTTPNRGLVELDVPGVKIEFEASDSVHATPIRLTPTPPLLLLGRAITARRLNPGRRRAEETKTGDKGYDFCGGSDQRVREVLGLLVGRKALRGLLCGRVVPLFNEKLCYDGGDTVE